VISSSSNTAKREHKFRAPLLLYVDRQSRLRSATPLPRQACIVTNDRASREEKSYRGKYVVKILCNPFLLGTFGSSNSISLEGGGERLFTRFRIPSNQSFEGERTIAPFHAAVPSSARCRNCRSGVKTLTRSVTKAFSVLRGTNRRLDSFFARQCRNTRSESKSIRAAACFRVSLSHS